MEWYYRFPKSSLDGIDEVRIPDGFELDVVRPHSNSMHDILWNLFSFGKYREYRLFDGSNGKIASKAQVMPKIVIFRFMKKGGVHIGPCFTNPLYRGRGFYPMLLKKIIADYRSRTDDFYIFCNEGNNASIRGIEKVGFKRFANGKKNKFGIYVIKEYI